MDAGSVPFVKGARWMRGARISVPLPLPFEFKLEPLGGGMGPHMPEYMDCKMPIFRNDLIEALQEAGVDNLELFDLTIVDPDNGQRYTDYKAVNIIGCIAAADMGKSEATVHPGGAVADVDFDKLVIDESKPQGALMFRLAESVNVIMVHKKVKEHLEAKGFKGIQFYDPGKIAT